MSCINTKLLYYHRTQFNKLYNGYVKNHKLTSHINHKLGDRVMMDWRGSIMNVYDRLTDEVTKAYLFAAILPFSMYTYVYSCKSMKQEEWIQCHIQMCNYFNGVTRLLVRDNLKTAVTHHKKYEDPAISKIYQEMAGYYDTSIVPTRVKKSKDKAGSK